MNLTPDDQKALFGTLARGSDAQVASLIYGGARLTDDERGVPLALLARLRLSDIDTAVRVLDAGYQDPFWLLVLLLRTRQLHPLLIVHEDGAPKLAGFVLPWNEIIPQFSEQQLAGANRLVVWWSQRLRELNPGASAS
ncbi:MAG TPA: hypothetical protein VFG04_14910 [Planctomycetaceae bacterium]|nr:hypothetical protein [Planctomycetaceae bacterium]